MKYSNEDLQKIIPILRFGSSSPSINEAPRRLPTLSRSEHHVEPAHQCFGPVDPELAELDAEEPGHVDDPCDAS